MPKTTITPLTSNAREPSGIATYKPQRFLSLRDVLDRLTISRSLLYELMKDPVQPFPPPVHLGRRSVWLEGEVEAYIRDIVDAERNCDRTGRNLAN